MTRAVLAASALAVIAAVPHRSRAQGLSQTVLCQGTYALCIKAPCVPIATLDRLGNYHVDHAACSCEVESGWFTGPGRCADCAKVTQHGHLPDLDLFQHVECNARKVAEHAVLYVEGHRVGLVLRRALRRRPEASRQGDL